MKIITDQKYIDRNVKITKYITWASLGVLGLGIYLTVTQKESTQTLIITFAALLIGFTLSQISIYMQNRWGKSPRPDELITAALKGLDDKHTLYLFKSAVPHLLVSPNGIWGIIAYSQQGRISYTADRWKLKGGSTFRKIFAGESLGRPDLDSESLVADYSRGFSKLLPGQDLPVLNVALVFTHPSIVIEAEDAPIPTIPLKKLKDLIRKKTKGELIPQGTVDAINGSLSR